MENTLKISTAILVSESRGRSGARPVAGEQLAAGAPERGGYEWNRTTDLSIMSAAL